MADGGLLPNNEQNTSSTSWYEQYDYDSLNCLQSIGAVEVWGRTDCCPEMTSNFYVFVSDNPFTSYDLNTTLNQAGVSNYYVSGYSGTPGTINVNRTGRYVRVQLAGSSYLVLGEVKVLRGSGGGAQNVSWTNAVGVTASGNNLTKTAGNGWGNAGAASTQTIASGDGYVEFTANETNTLRMCGLSNGDTNQDYGDIDFAFYPWQDGVLYIFEGGNNRGTFGTYANGDTLRVAVEGGVVKYRKNGTLIYTSTVAPSYPLLVDTALYSTGATINNVVISSGSGSSSGGADVNWLVADHLGTPRMIFDKTGSLATTKRHDYLPFGEELFVGQGLRTTQQGYVADNVRQKFTDKERDTETGLDYFGARYYASMQGRFTSVDPENAGVDIRVPQSWNGYGYVLNNPLLFIDPSGMVWLHDTKADLYLWVDDEDYIEGNKYFDDNSYVPVPTSLTGSGGITFVLTRGSYVDRYPDLVGREVYLGRDGQLHDTCPPCQALATEMTRQNAAFEQGVVAFAAISVAAGAGIGGVGYYTGIMAGGGLASGGITTLGLQTAVSTEVVSISTVSFSQATLRAFERQLEQHGRRSLERSLRTFEKKLATHLSKIEQARKAGGYTSSMEREVETAFRPSIEAIKQILARKP